MSNIPSKQKVYVVNVDKQTELPLCLWLRQNNYKYSIPMQPVETKPLHIQAEEDQGNWTIKYLSDEVQRLEAQLKRYSDLAVHLSSAGRDPNEKCYSKHDVEMLISIARAGEAAATATEIRPLEPNGDGSNNT